MNFARDYAGCSAFTQTMKRISRLPQCQLGHVNYNILCYLVLSRHSITPLDERSNRLQKTQNNASKCRHVQITYRVQLTIWSRPSTLNEWKSASSEFSTAATITRTGRQVVVKIRAIIATRPIANRTRADGDFVYLKQRGFYHKKATASLETLMHRCAWINMKTWLTHFPF